MGWKESGWEWGKYRLESPLSYRVSKSTVSPLAEAGEWGLKREGVGPIPRRLSRTVVFILHAGTGLGGLSYSFSTHLFRAAYHDDVCAFHLALGFTIGRGLAGKQAGFSGGFVYIV